MSNEFESVPRMRGYKAAIAELKKRDPASAVSEYFLRRAVKQGLVPCVKAGGRDLINFDALLAYLADPKPVKVDVRRERWAAR